MQKKMGKILIADNDHDVLIALEHALESGGYTTVTAINEDEVLHLIGQENVDLCVLDDYLSDEVSIEVLVKFPDADRKPMVIVTYYRSPSPGQEKQFRSLGVSAFVNKGTPSELVGIVSQLLEPRTNIVRGAFDEMT